MFSSPFLPTLLGVPSCPEVAPLLHGLEERGDLKLEFRPTDQLRDGLLRGEWACALVSPAVMLEDCALRVIPGAGLVALEGSDKARMVTKLPVQSIRRIHVAAGAEALMLYIQILFAERGLPSPRLVPTGDPEPADAILTLGEPTSSENLTVINVEALWREATDLPLVLALWACRDSSPIRMLRMVLGEAARRGETELDNPGYGYRLLSAESECLRTLHRLARKHAIAGASVESIGFC